jgi:peptidoglycan/LPS O-acetylase OafA/YrhL
VSSDSAANRFGYLDTLRVIGAAIVMYFHFLETQPMTAATKFIMVSGIGVSTIAIFFIISGYVMPFTIKRGLDVRDFAIRRLMRMFPLYFVAIFAIWALGATGVLKGFAFIAHADAAAWAANLLIMQDFLGVTPFLAVSWTLGLEIVWYIIFIVAVSLLGKRASLTLGILAPLGMLALAGLSLLIHHRIPLGRPAMLYSAALGWQLYAYSTGEMSRRAMLGWVMLFIAVTVVTNYVAFGIFHHERVALLPAIMGWLAAPLAFAAIMLWPKLRTAPGIATGPLPAIGVTTYSIYLLHPIALTFTREYFAMYGSWVQVAIYTALTAALTLVGYYGVERAGIILGRRLSDWSRRARNPKVAIA